MSGFCGFLGKTDGIAIEDMVTALDKDCGHAPVCFSDGYIHFGFMPYLLTENKQIGHNANFTIWAMIDCGYPSKGFEAVYFIEQYEKKGISFLKELEGTFSAVLWDGMKQRLYFFRDRYGAKPLYYAKMPTGIMFATEIASILRCNGFDKAVNRAAIYQYMSFGSVYTPETVFENLYHISPGCYGVYTDGRFEEIKYAKLPFDKKSDDGFSEAAENIHKLLGESVLRCTGEENTGIFLSGGLDSSLIAALAREGSLEYSFCLKPATRTGSIHQKEDDAYFSAYLANKYGIKHHMWEMTPQDLVDGMDDIIGSFSQPFSSTVSTYFLAKNASGICKRILTGDGADELFGSYGHHSAAAVMEKYAFLKEAGESFIGKEEELVPYDKNIPFLDSLYQFGGSDDTLWYYRLLQMGDNEKSIFLNRDMFGEYIDERSTIKKCVRRDKNLKSKGALNRSLERDFKHLLPGHTMLYQDTLTRKFGVNVAMPFLDNGLTDYVVTLPQEYKINRGITKAVLKEAGRGVLPDEIINRRKEPFSLPITEWLKTDLKEFMTDILCEDSVRKYGLLNAECVQYALNEFYKYPNTKEYYGRMLWSMAMLQKWAMLYM